MAHRLLSRLRPLADAKGTAAVEFGLLLPVLAVLFVGVTELGRAIWQHHIAVKALRDATRYLARVPDDTGAYFTAAANLGKTGILGSDGTPILPGLTFAFSYENTSSPVAFYGSRRMVRGTATYEFKPLTGYAFAGPMTLTAMHVERFLGKQELLP